MKLVLSVAILTLFIAPLVHGQVFDIEDFTFNSRYTSMGFTLQNDAMLERPTDYDYTNGFQLTLQGLFGNQLFQELCKQLFPIHYNEGTDINVLQTAQNMYTPSDLRNKNVILDQRPYAGWTRIGFFLGGQRSVSSLLTDKQFESNNTSEMFGFSVGQLGDAGAGFSQTWVHKILREISGRDTPPLPEGWAYHIQDRLAYYAIFDTKTKQLRGQLLFAGLGDPSNRSTVDISVSGYTHSITELGNVFDRQSFGVEGRLSFILSKKNYQGGAFDLETNEVHQGFVIEPFFKANLILTAYNGTLEPENGASYAIYMVPIAASLITGLEANIDFASNADENILKVRWLPFMIQTADFVQSYGTSLMDFRYIFHGIGSVSLQYGWSY